MSLLHQEERDDAARGDDLTKGTSHIAMAAVVAALIVGAAIAIYAIAGRKPPFATAEISAVWAHAQHTQTSGHDASGAPVPIQSIDQVMVFAKVRLHNQTNHPLFLGNIVTNVTLADGSIHSSYAAGKGDYDRVFVAYPNLPVPHGQPISPLDTTLAAGQTAEGMFFSAFRMTQRQWDARKSLDFTFNFRYQPALTVAPHGTILDR